MTRASALLLTLLTFAAPATAASPVPANQPVVAPSQSQQTVFGPVQPDESASTAKVDEADDTSLVLYISIAIIILLFIGIGVYIMRDARGSLTTQDREALERPTSPDQTQSKMHHAQREKVRKKGREARAARKRTKRKR